MMFVRIKGFKFYKDRHGTPRCYHRASSEPIDLKEFPIGSAGFVAEVARIGALTTPNTTKRNGTFGHMVKSYRASDDFLGLSKRTRADYDRCFDYLSSIGDVMISKFTPPLIVGIRDKAAKKMGRKWGNYTKTCISIAFSWGIEHGFADTNPAFRIKGKKRPKDAEDVNPPWSDEHRHAVLADLPGDIDVEIHLMMFCGLDPGDVVKLPKTAINAAYQLNTRRQKTKEPVWVDLPKPVIGAIERRARREAVIAGERREKGKPELPTPMTFCWNTYHKQRTKSGLDSAWQKYRAKLIADRKLPATATLTLKGLRHTVATILAEMGRDDRTIADMLGQKTIAMAQHYSKNANRAKKLAGVVQDFNAEIERRKPKIV